MTNFVQPDKKWNEYRAALDTVMRLAPELGYNFIKVEYEHPVHAQRGSRSWGAPFAPPAQPSLGTGTSDAHRPLLVALFDVSAELARYVQREGTVSTRDAIFHRFLDAVLDLDRAEPPVPASEPPVASTSATLAQTYADNLIELRNRVLAVIDGELATWHRLGAEARERMAPNVSEFETAWHAVKEARGRVAAAFTRTVAGKEST